MTETTIPVDLRNPGQVFACLGLMEVAEALGFEDVEGGFEWSKGSSDSFSIVSEGDCRPVYETIRFLNNASIQVSAPSGVIGPWPDDVLRAKTFPAPPSEILISKAKGYSASALPLALACGAVLIPISNWLEGDGRSALKTFAGQQVAAKILAKLLVGDERVLGLRQAFPDAMRQDLVDPLKQTGPIASRFCFDSRGAWDALRLGTSLDTTKTMVEVSPLVEVLAVIGLENARPIFLSTYEIAYFAWAERLPMVLARAALSQASSFLPAEQVRNFRASLGSDKQYKKCFSSVEILGT